MEIKEASTIAAATSIAPSLQELPQAVQGAAQSSGDPVSVAVTQNDLSKSATVEAINRVISVVNVATEATTEIEKLVKSIDGIVTQVAEKELPPQRVQALQKEAEGLVAAIQREAGKSAGGGVKPLAGDQVNVELESLGKALEVILPSNATSAFGLSSLSFTTKETILRTRATVAEARQQLEKLRASVDKSREIVSSTASEVDVALANGEASGSSLRNVETALKFAGDLTSGISSDPERALGSISTPANALQLLR